MSLFHKSLSLKFRHIILALWFAYLVSPLVVLFVGGPKLVSISLNGVSLFSLGLLYIVAHEEKKRGTGEELTKTVFTGICGYMLLATALSLPSPLASESQLSSGILGMVGGLWAVLSMSEYLLEREKKAAAKVSAQTAPATRM